MTVLVLFHPAEGQNKRVLRETAVSAQLKEGGQLGEGLEKRRSVRGPTWDEETTLPGLARPPSQQAHTQEGGGEGRVRRAGPCVEPQVSCTIERLRRQRSPPAPPSQKYVVTW